MHDSSAWERSNPTGSPYDDAMQGWLEPIGPEAPRTYWIRRAVVLVVLLAVIVGIIWLVGRPKAVTATPPSTTPSNSAVSTPQESSSTPSGTSSAPSETPSAEPSDEPSATLESAAGEPSESSAEPSADQTTTPEPSATESAPAACQPRSLKLRVDGPSSVVVTDEAADFHVVVSTTESSCQLDLAENKAALTITSGNDEIWKTADCPDWQPGGVVDLVAGEESGFDVSWPVKRAHGCELAGEVLGPGTYVATASVGQTSARLVMQLRY